MIEKYNVGVSSKEKLLASGWLLALAKHLALGLPKGEQNLGTVVTRALRPPFGKLFFAIISELQKIIFKNINATGTVTPKSLSTKSLEGIH